MGGGERGSGGVEGILIHSALRVCIFGVLGGGGGGRSGGSGSEGGDTRLEIKLGLVVEV